MRPKIGATILLASMLVLAPALRAPASDPPPPAPPPAERVPAAQDGSSPAAPRLEIEREALDLGTVMRGSTAEGSFVLRNAGSDVLRILSAKPG